MKRAATAARAPARSKQARKTSARGQAPARVREVLKRLEKTYPDAQCALRHSNPFQLLVSTILSAQCTDERVNKVTPGLFQKYQTPRDFAALRQEVLAELAPEPPAGTGDQHRLALVHQPVVSSRRRRA